MKLKEKKTFPEPSRSNSVCISAQVSEGPKTEQDHSDDGTQHKEQKDLGFSMSVMGWYISEIRLFLCDFIYFYYFFFLGLSLFSMFF